MAFSETLQRLRKAAGLSQTELAQRSGTSIDSLRNWEQGRALPKIDIAMKLAKALGVSCEEFAEDGSIDADLSPARLKKPAAKPARKRRSI